MWNNTLDTLTTTASDKRSVWSLQLTLLTLFFVLIAVWILVANTMIVVAPIIYKPLRKKTYIFVSSLAVSDLVTGIVIPAAWFLSSLDNMDWELYQKVESEVYCQLIQFCNVFPLICSVFNLLLIAVDRFIGVLYPLKYKIILSSKTSKILLVLVWILSIVIAAINFFWNRQYSEEGLKCYVIDMAPLYFHILGCIYWILAVAMLILYSCMYRVITTGEHSQLRASRRNAGTASKSERNTAKMLFITLAVFVCSWSPLVVSLHIYVVHETSLLAVQICHILAYLNSGMNFFIYVFRNRKYNSAFKMMLPLCYKRPPSAISDSSESRLRTPSSSKSLKMSMQCAKSPKTDESEIDESITSVDNCNFRF